MAIEARGPGDTAHRVAANVRALRKKRGLDLAQLSVRLFEVGQPISLKSLSKLENGQRRVDVDDLVGLALALDVTPNRLLLTETASNVEEVSLTDGVRASSRVAWRWACGERPITAPSSIDIKRDVSFGTVNRPHDPPDDMTAGELLERDKRGEFDSLKAGYRDVLGAGLTLTNAVGYLRLLDNLNAISYLDSLKPRGDDDGQR